jgi:hypothetical protein
MKTSKKNIVKNRCMTRKFRVGYLTSCQTWYWKPIEDLKLDWWKRKPVHMSRLIWVYDYGASKGYIDITFEWFKSIVLEKKSPEAELYPLIRKPYKSRWVFHDHSRSVKYQKGEGHGVKDRDQLEANKLWRDRVGKTRDHRRRYNWHRGPDRFWKRCRSKTHRRWVDLQLVREDYDKFHRKEREEHCDSWCWD